MNSIPAQGPWRREFTDSLLAEVQSELRETAQQATLRRIRMAEESLTRKWTVGPGPCLLACRDEGDRFTIQCQLAALHEFVRELTKQINSEELQEERVPVEIRR